MAGVGDLVITQSNVRQRNEVIKIYYPQETQDFGLKQLTRAFVDAQILKNNGFPLTEERVKAEAQRIDQGTKDANTLAKIKKIFGGNEADYFKVFVLPTLAERTIYFDFFRNSPVIHRESKERAIQFSKAGEKGSYSTLAKKQGLKYQKITIKKDSPLWMKKISERLASGKKVATPIDMGDTWLVSKKREAVFIPKIPYTDWLARETAKVPVVTY